MRSILSLFLIGFSISCLHDIDIQNTEINGTFVHKITDCDNSANPEESCTEYVWFNDNSTANIMIGGIDYGTRVTYKLINNRIDFYYTNGIKAELSFEIKNEMTLIRIEDNEIWNKEL